MYEDFAKPSEGEIEEYYEQLNNSKEHFNFKTMKTGNFTSTIESIFDVKGDGVQWRGVYYHSLVMANGDKINIGKKSHLNDGDSVSYEVLEVGQQEYCKAKTWNPDYDNGAPSSNNTQSAAKKSNGSPNASFALSYAKDVYVAHGGTDPDNSIEAVTGYITGIADEFLTWLNEKNN